jgi:hypothetical protein
MSKNPCKEEKERALQASKDWEKASEDARRFLVTKPLDAESSLQPKSPEYLDALAEAYQKEAAARNRYIDAMNTWHACEEGTS